MMFTKRKVNCNGYVAGAVRELPSVSSMELPQGVSSSYSFSGKMYCVIGKVEDKPDFHCYPYRLSGIRYVLMISTYILSAGFMWLVFYWRPDWKLKFTHFITSFDNCSSVLLEAQDGTRQVFVSKVEYADESVKKWAPYLFSSPTAPSTFYSNGKNLYCYQNSHDDDEASKSSDSGEVWEDRFDKVKFFHHHLTKYMWDKELRTFVKVEGFDGNVSLDYVLKSANEPLTEQTERRMKDLFGENVIRVQIPSYVNLLVAEVLNPFYVFQLAACLFWLADEYYAYATAIIIISFISAVISLINIRRERVALHDMVERHNSSQITVIRDKKRLDNHPLPTSSNKSATAKEYITQVIWVKDLVPGDVVIIPSSGVQLSFDAALITGSCIVNESMLTGESVPVTKTPLPSGESELLHVFKVEEQKAHVLFCGTEVVQTRYYQDEVVRAIVVRTGFGTAKGQLVHSILFPKPVNLRLLRDSYRFVGVMCMIAFVGFGFSAYTLVNNGESARDIAFKSIDIITITVPPALPLAMTIGIIYAQDRLKKAYIRTISPQRINICGQVDVVAFDKTGTLTEEGLDLAKVIPVNSGKFNTPINPEDVKLFDKESDLLRCMATCHSLTVIDGNTSGDPLDLKMFEATGFKLVEPKGDETAKYDQLQTTYVRPNDDVSFSSRADSKIFKDDGSYNSNAPQNEVGIIRQFPFLSSLQRASVITKPLCSDPMDMTVYVKGAPETIAVRCIASSIPDNFSSVLKHYTKEGYRVIALSYKKLKLKWLKAQKIERNKVEKDLELLGFLILQNKLKPSSPGVICALDKASIRTVMVTGDNLETAISVGKECNILKKGKAILGAKTDISGECPTIKWHCIECEHSKNGNALSSSEELNLSEAVIVMGDSAIPIDCQLAITGSSFAVIKDYFPQFVKPLSVQGAVFARMSPSQKTELMEELEAVDYHTLMCGDGANDCGALKRAHVGLSLSELEASVAAPFTANVENGIESVVTLMREGRAALVTSFGMFKFMALYSMIQFTTILLLYQNNTILGDYQFLYIDLIIIDFVAVTMSRNHAYKNLDKKKPPSSLICAEMLITLFLQIALQMGLQILAFLLVQRQCWFRHPVIVNETSGQVVHGNTLDISGNVTPISFTTFSDYCPQLANADNVTSVVEDTPKTYETTTLAFVSSFMYLSVSVAFSHGKPFRTPIYKNKWFLSSLLFLACFSGFMMFFAPLEFNEFMEFWRIPDLKFLVILCVIALSHLFLALLIECFFVENPRLWFVIKSFCGCRRKSPQKSYKMIEHLVALSDTSNEFFSFPSQFEGEMVYSKTPVKRGPEEGVNTML